jgi:hypothetical protein
MHKRFSSFWAIFAFMLCFIIVAPAAFAKVDLSDTPDPKRINVLNPRGYPDGIPLIPMAERTASLEGRPIYLVDTRFMNGDIFLLELQKLLAEKYPTLKTEFRTKYGGYTEDDPKLWKEIKDNNGVMIVSIGH